MLARTWARVRAAFARGPLTTAELGRALRRSPHTAADYVSVGLRSGLLTREVDTRARQTGGAYPYVYSLVGAPPAPPPVLPTFADPMDSRSVCELRSARVVLAAVRTLQRALDTHAALASSEAAAGAVEQADANLADALAEHDADFPP